jgi:glycolate oxidase iron-sulfur subunit
MSGQALKINREPACNTLSLKSNYPYEDAPDAEKFSECVHCGMCLEACPTYQEEKLEAHSPRGRVYLIKSVAEGKMALNDVFKEPVFTCLDCRACETACPTGVQVGSLIEKARGQLYKASPPGGWKGLASHFFLRGVFPYPKRLRLLGKTIRVYQKSGLQTYARRLKLLKVLPSHLQEMEAALPVIPKSSVLSSYPDVLPAIGEKRARVAVLTGCVMDVVFSDINEATIRVLRRNGCEVLIPKNQGCCGALQVHAGDRDTAKRLARRNIDAFVSEEFDAIIVNAAGCGAALKEYEEWLETDPDYKKKAAIFSNKIRDVSQFIAEIGLIRPRGHLDVTVTYHDACHLAHAQGVRAEPRQLLAAIPGLKMVDLPDADRCCGSAGIYNITNPEMAGALLDRKMEDIPRGCDMVAMGNPGCMIQFQVGIVRYNRREQIVHTVQLLDWAYQKEEEEHAVSPAIVNNPGR